MLSLFIYLANKDKTYLFYGLYILSISLYFLWNVGFLSNYIFPELPDLNLYFWIFFPLSPFFYFMFLREFLDIRLHAKKLDKMVKWTAYTSIITCLLGIIIQTIFYHTFYPIIISDVVLLLQIVFGLWLFKVLPKNSKLFKIALFGNITLAATAVYSIISYFLGKQNFSNFGQGGTLFELLVFAVGLGYRVKLIEDKKRKAQAKFIYQLKKNKQLQEDINKDLEIKVAQRTYEVNEKNKELEAQNIEIAAQRDDIYDKSEKLRLIKEHIQKMNLQLEEEVASRTEELVNAKHELDLFLYRTSHDLRGPFARIEGLLQLARLNTLTPNNEIWNYFDHVTNEMDDILEKLLAISIINNSPEKIEKIKVESLIDTLNQIFNKQKGYIEYHFKEGLSFKSKTQLVLLILKAMIDNSLKFHHNEPTIRICFQSLNGKELIITVIDSGDGIKKDILPKIFDMFFVGSDKSKGNGLGLFIALKAANRSNATIDVKSEPEKGTRFTVKLPEIL
ncbi:ATP-binding protein [Chondrinema litorale]|uniref:ATP-binding protein n=1 Tax=Chondrinema litorale TaxID=2994555 RepID=UPI0025439021|nr:ATP-binding protein [Chondrinema litorale]UZR99672.1 ATP-binding protein [Chondrinema litorale]